MNSISFLRSGSGLITVCRWLALSSALRLAAAAVTATGAEKSVPQYDRFEQSFESSVSYDNPAQAAELTVTFTAPSGDKFKVHGFWDGGKVWRIRFAPTQPGQWKFESICSDPKNKGLHAQSSSFKVTPSAGKTRFSQHGPVRVSPDGRCLMHDDGTPFFWMGDTAWN